jgi:hypothetical protein
MRTRIARVEDKIFAAIMALESSVFAADDKADSDDKEVKAEEVEKTEEKKEEVKASVVEKVADADTELVVEEKAITVEDKKVVNESVPAGDVTLKDVGNQNDKMGKNWPISASERVVIARQLVAMAKQLIAD